MLDVERTIVIQEGDVEAVESHTVKIEVHSGMYFGELAFEPSSLKVDGVVVGRGKWVFWRDYTAKQGIDAEALRAIATLLDHYNSTEAEP